MRNRPQYTVQSVDNALRLAQLLQQTGGLGVVEAAQRLGVASSTAHRLLSVLVHRDFAEQDDDRVYRPGFYLRPFHGGHGAIAELGRLARPAMEALVKTTNESCNLTILDGTDVRFIASHECDQTLRVTDRLGRVLAAEHTSGGLALLAALPTSEVERRYEGHRDRSELLHRLSLIRQRGFAVNRELSEAGLSAVGVIVRDASHVPAAALSLAMPSVRFHPDSLRGWLSALASAVEAIESATVDDAAGNTTEGA